MQKRNFNLKKLIYLNLFIDNDWDKEKIIDQIFSFRIESSESILKSYSHFGLFLGTQNDIALIETPVDLDFVSYLELNFGPLAKPVLLQDYSPSLLVEADLILVGVSDKESSCFGNAELGMRGYLGIDDYIRINQKDYLLTLADKLKFQFPSSKKIKLKDFLASKIDNSHCVKFLNSSGGRGVFKINTDSQMLSFLERQLEDNLETLEVIKQQYIDVSSHFYTIYHTESTGNPYGFSIDYDSNGNSIRHVLQKSISTERDSLAKKVATVLKSEGYKGSFGFDGFKDRTGVEYPAIDLNVRIDKSRVFHEIIKRSDLSDVLFEIRRERIAIKGYEGFKDFFIKRIKDLEIINKSYKEKFKLVILMCSNLFHTAYEPTIGELTLMLTRSLDSKNEDYEKWLEECYDQIGVNNYEK